MSPKGLWCLKSQEIQPIIKVDSFFEERVLNEKALTVGVTAKVTQINYSRAIDMRTFRIPYLIKSSMFQVLKLLYHFEKLVAENLRW